MEKATGISPVDWWCCVVMGMICYDVLSCRDDHHRCYNPHHEDLTVSPVAGRGNVGWRPCGETRPNWIYRQHHLRHTRRTPPMPEVIVQVKIMCDKFLPKFYCVYLDMTTATYIPSPWRPHHHQADHKLVRVGPQSRILRNCVWHPHRPPTTCTHVHHAGGDDDVV